MLVNGAQVLYCTSIYSLNAMIDYDVNVDLDTNMNTCYVPFLKSLVPIISSTYVYDKFSA